MGCICGTQEEEQNINIHFDEIVKHIYQIPEYSISKSHFSITSAVERSLMRKDSGINMMEFDYLKL